MPPLSFVGTRCAQPVGDNDDLGDLVDEDDRSEDVGWSNLSDLTSKERASYDSCVQRTLSGQGAGQPSASPSPSGSATPTPSPTPTKQSASASPTAG